MPYDLSRFSPQSFERFIQSLAASLLGGKVQIFGGARDGAREATYNGKCDLGKGEWDGYVVIQAKYNLHPAEPAENADWLIQQIDRELAKFADERRALPAPQYYLLATNTRLSASAANREGSGEGGIDRVTKHLEVWRAKLGIIEIHLWHADTLYALLDVNEEIRTSFSFWVQPSDVLAQILRHFSGPAREDVLYRYLRKGLGESRDVKTRDAGQTTGKATALDEVFIDLPVDQTSVFAFRDWGDFSIGSDRMELRGEIQHTFDLSEIDLDLVHSPHGGQLVLATLVALCSDKFDAYDRIEIDTQRPRGPLKNRVVLLGGPGQGKSTISQFFAQLCRARILSDTDTDLSPELHEVINSVLRRATEESISLNGPLRYPFHIELPRFADRLNQARLDERSLSIIAYLANRVSAMTEEDISVPLMRQWIGHIPAVIILDGLDEVPHSGNRADVILSIRELIDDIHGLNSDALILVTSRPQGYQEELSKKYWAHWEMEHLDADDALRFANRLALVRVTDEIRRAEIIDILTNAASDEATSPLMISPLQITLLFSLVETRNNIPKDRWTLFHRHYEILRDREIAKGGKAGQIIGDYKSQIDRIHYDAGYLLHVRAEAVGSAHAFFSLEEFSEVVRRQMRDDGYEDDLDDLTKQIVNIATTRLVFLGCGTDEQVAFDVRSLQEFMAAARMTTSPEAKIAPRLSLIAGRAHWLHVFKIACSKIYASAEAESLRDMIVGVLANLDDGDRSFDDFQVRTGSRLAVQLLSDGLAHSVPAQRRKLLLRGLHLMEAPNAAAPGRLAALVDSTTKGAVEPPLVQVLQKDGAPATAALKFLALLSNSRDVGVASWAAQLLTDWLSSAPAGVLEVFSSHHLIPETPKLMARLRKAQWATPPGDLLEWEQQFEREPEGPDDLKRVLVYSARDRLNRGCILKRADGTTTDIEFRFASSFEPWRMKRVPSDALPEWKILQEGLRFIKDPTPARLADVLTHVAELDCLGAIRKARLPWLFHVFLEAAKDNASLLSLAERIRKREFGDQTDWRNIEERWCEEGVTVSSILRRLKESNPESVNLDGMPLPSALALDKDKQSGLRELLEVVKAAPESYWAKVILVNYLKRASLPRLEASVIDSICDSLERAVALPTAGRVQALINVLRTSERRAKLDALIVSMMSDVETGIHSHAAAFDKLAALFNDIPSARSLLPALATGARSMGHKKAQLAVVRSLNAAAFEHETTDSPAITAAVTMLRLSSNSLTEDQAAADAVSLVATDNPSLGAMLTYGERSGEKDEVRQAFIVTASRQLLQRPGSPHIQQAYRILSNFIEAQETKLDDSKVSGPLELPAYIKTHVPVRPARRRKTIRKS